MQNRQLVDRKALGKKRELTKYEKDQLFLDKNDIFDIMTEFEIDEFIQDLLRKLVLYRKTGQDMKDVKAEEQYILRQVNNDRQKIGRRQFRNIGEIEKYFHEKGQPRGKATVEDIIKERNRVRKMLKEGRFDEIEKIFKNDLPTVMALALLKVILNDYRISNYRGIDPAKLFYYSNDPIVLQFIVDKFFEDYKTEQWEELHTKDFPQFKKDLLFSWPPEPIGEGNKYDDNDFTSVTLSKPKKQDVSSAMVSFNQAEFDADKAKFLENPGDFEDYQGEE